MGILYCGCDPLHICPDIVTLGKPIGNGHPIAMVVTTKEVASRFEAQGAEYFNTYGGNPVSVAVASAVLDVIENEKLQQHAKEVGNYLLASLRELQQRHPLIGDVRLKQSGVLLSTEGKYGNVLKFKPPMVFNHDNVDTVVSKLDTLLTKIEDECVDLRYNFANVARSLASSAESLSTASSFDSLEESSEEDLSSSS
ncbi:hypothetical protein HPB52_024457 [Rhipicephalus sanguineus]|uniref:Uncharacterized protein n=1 Tax=Rhipicephalus sanguineus TaxID=34632 RepID=A0A9D4YS58_RHISA|nr:hypothetical protein HPB52_024457 [Rhipicephalus sanguineus]